MFGSVVVVYVMDGVEVLVGVLFVLIEVMKMEY